MGDLLQGLLQKEPHRRIGAIADFVSEPDLRHEAKVKAYASWNREKVDRYGRAELHLNVCFLTAGGEESWVFLLHKLG